MKSLIERENTIFEILEKFNEQNLNYILVGGYAVSAFSHRFSVDADIVIKEKDKRKFQKILKEKGFKKTQKKRIEDVYKGVFMSYEKKEKLPVNVDILINSIKCRQTEGSWSYEYLNENSIQAEIEGSERSIEAKIPEKELLIALKLHSSRLTDARDVISLSENTKLNKIEKHINRGEKERLKESLERVINIIDSERFEDSYKGVFSEKKIPEEDIKRIRSFLEGLIEEKSILPAN